MLRSFAARAALLASFLALHSTALWAEETQPEYAPPPLPPTSQLPPPTSELPLPEGPFGYYGAGVVPGCVDKGAGLGCTTMGAQPGYAIAEDGSLIEGTATCGKAVCWTFQADAIFLRRDEDSVAQLVDGTVPYGIESLDLECRFGPRLSLIRHNVFGTFIDGEVTYFGVDGWNTQLASGGATTFFTNPNINFAARTVTTTYRERLYSVEFNGRWQALDGLTLIQGFRVLELHDDLFTDLVGSSHQINVNNHLYGYQLGVDWRMLCWNNFDLNVWGKAGIYGNSADQETNIVNVGGAVPFFGAAGGNAAFVGEVGVVGKYWMTNWVALRAGYQVLWLDGVATAPNQIATSDITTGVAAMNFAETLMYHGGFTGLEFVW